MALMFILSFSGQAVLALDFTADNPDLLSEQALPSDFFTDVRIGKTLTNPETGEMEAFGSNVAWDASCALWFSYTVPEHMTVHTAYTFSVVAPLVLADNFSIRDGAVVVAEGALVPDGTGTVHGTLTFLDQNYLTEGTTGYFYVAASFDKDQLSGGGRQTVSVIIPNTSISASTEIDFAAPVAKAGVTLIKTSDAATNLHAHQVDWTLTITPHVSGLMAEYVNSLLVTDPLQKQGLVYVENSAEATRQDGTAAEGALAYNAETGMLTFSGAGQDLTAASWPITVKLKTQYAPDKLTPDSSGKVTFANDATAVITAPQYIKDSNGTVTLEDSTAERVLSTANADANASAEVVCASLTKAGALLSGSKVHWTVTATNGLAQDNPHIVDTLPADMKLSGSVTLNNAALAEWSGTGTGYAFNTETRKLTVYLEASLSTAQTIEYDTIFNGADVSSISSVVNHVDFFVGPGTAASLSKTAAVNFGSALMSKSGIYDRQTHTVTWTIGLKTKDKTLSNVVLTDLFGQSINGTSVKQTYVDSSLRIKGESGEYVSIAPTSVLADDTGFVLNLSDPYDAAVTDYTLTYQTVLDSTDAARAYWGSNWSGEFPITNTTTLAATGLDAKATITAASKGISQMLEKAFVSYDYNNKSAEWKLTVNQNQMAMTNGRIVDTLSSADWKYDQTTGSVTIRQGDKTVLTGADVSYAANAAGLPMMMISLPNTTAGEAPFVITYHTKPADEKLLLTNEKLTVNNAAVLTGDSVQASGVAANIEQTLGQSVLEKSSGALDETTNELTWTVDVNRNLATIPAGSEGDIGIQDTLPQGLRYVPDSLKVVPLTIGVSGADGTVAEGAALTAGTDYIAEYDASSRKLTLVWPHKTELTAAYRVTFRTLVMVSGSYSNSISFISSLDSSWQTSDSEIRSALFSGGSTKLAKTLGSLLIQKTDGNTGNALPNVKLTLRDSGETLIGEFLTDSNGQINAVLPVGVYTVEEITPPDNYVLPTVHTWSVTVESRKLVTLRIPNYQDQAVATLSPQVTKAITGSAIPPATEFAFKLAPVTLNAPMPSADTASVTGEGTARFGQIQYTSEGVYEYTITEQDGKTDRFTYDTTPHSLIVTVKNENGQLTATAKYDTDLDALTVTNIYTRPSSGDSEKTPTGSLTISKQVTGASADKTKPFLFTVSFSGTDRRYSFERSGGFMHGWLKSGDSFSLKDGQSITISGLPAGTSYTVTEADYRAEGYAVSAAGNVGTIRANTVSKADFLNIKTGVLAPVIPTTPTEPTTPDIPSYSPSDVPSPSDPSSPNQIIIIDKNGTTKYHREQMPDGKYVYLDEDGNPLANLVSDATQAAHSPQTGTPVSVKLLIVLMLICAVGASVLVWIVHRLYR